MGADSIQIASDVFQRPGQYLWRVQKDENVTNFTYNGANGHVLNSHEIIATLKTWSSLTNPTWAQLYGFSKLLNEQLKSCEQNAFVKSGDLPGFKAFLIKNCFIKMAQDFALPSLSVSDTSPLFGLEQQQTTYAAHQLRRRWENDPHPYVFFNSDLSTFTFLGFVVQNTNLLDCNGKILAAKVMSDDLEKQIRRQAYDEPEILGENFDKLPRPRRFIKLCRVLGVENEVKGKNIDSNYELTQDNVLKILAIYMRFRCDIPVVIMGETGCGKTRLIEYLCLLMGRGKTLQNKKIVKVHGGVTVDDIVRNVEEVEALAKENTRNFGRDFYTVLFFDEANTTEAIYAIKEVVCDFSVNGRKLDPNSGLKIIVACNPYRKHDEKMIKKLESQGLGYHVKSSETEDKLDSNIPMRHLVYRVNPLPPSLLPLVWDFGQLTSQVEDKYIKQIVARHAPKLNLNDKDTQFVCEVLSISQKFLRENRDQCLFVSLRDIERAMIVLHFFYSRKAQLLVEMDAQRETQSETRDNENSRFLVKEIARLMILTVGACYHSSLDQRKEYRLAISSAFRGEFKLPDNGPYFIWREIEVCQRVFLDKLQLDGRANIAKNNALSENVFMMIVCIELRIPLFLVGKPGSSKSLSKLIVVDAMQGASSRDDFFKHLKQVQMLSFQCSPHTNADGIVSVFKQASLYQEGKNLSTFVSVVVLDEIGLAEDSPKMPLKALHPLLEEGFVENGKEPSCYSKVAFVGISNWALDPAKMNRGILVNRKVPKIRELVESGRGICRCAREGKPIANLIDPLAHAYGEILRKQLDDEQSEYFGLRDFYGLLKMLHQEFVRNNETRLDWISVQRSIRRNFGQKDDGAFQTFVKHLKNIFPESSLSSYGNIDSLSLVKQNVKEAEIRSSMTPEQQKMDNESRYLLIMTENFSALRLLPVILASKNYEVIFGSTFPKDQEYIQICRNINRIKMCMETGTTVVLLNLGSLYESLYDALNQYYIYYGGRRFVDLGLGSNRVKCSVSENFRLIIIEEEKIARQFPIPLLNRLEKHFLGMESMLDPTSIETQKRICKNLEVFANVPRIDSTGDAFTVKDAFVGYQDDTSSYIITQVQKDSEIDVSDVDVYQRSIERLFQTCTKEAILRADIENYPLEAEHLLHSIGKQGKKNLEEFLWTQLYTKEKNKCYHLIEVTTFGKIPSQRDIKQINRTLMGRERTRVSDDRHATIDLNTLQTEQELNERVSSFVRSSQHIDCRKILFITCTKAQRLVSVIACTKYSLQNMFFKAKDPNVFVLFLVQIPRLWYKSNYSSFSVGEWNTFHVDKLHPEVEIESMMQTSERDGAELKDLFVLEKGQCSKFQQTFLRDVIHEAIADSQNLGIDKVFLVSKLFQLFEEQKTRNFEKIFLAKVSQFIGNRRGSTSNLRSIMKKKASNLSDLIQYGDIEHSLYHTLKLEVRPHLSEFLQTVNRNGNFQLLFGEVWRQELWIKLFSAKKIMKESVLPSQSASFKAAFPFSKEIISKMDELWAEAEENSGDQNMETVDYFLHCFESREGDHWETLRQLSTNQMALDAFTCDLVAVKIVGDVTGVKSDHHRLIQNIFFNKRSKSSQEMSLALAFAICRDIRPEIVAVAPLLRLEETVSGTVPADIPFSHFFLDERIKRLLKDAAELKTTKQNIGKFVEGVETAKLCLTRVSKNPDFAKDSDFQYQMEKLSIYSKFLREISYGLDNDLTSHASSAGVTLWKCIEVLFTEKEPNFSRYKRFLEDFTTCLQRSAKRVEQKIIADKTKNPRTVEPCGSLSWDQFGKNISHVFITVIKTHFVNNLQPEFAKELLKATLIFKEDNKPIPEPVYMNDQSRQALMTVFALQNFELLLSTVEQLVDDYSKNKQKKLDCYMTSRCLMAVFDCLLCNELSVELPQTRSKFMNEIIYLVKMKKDVRDYCHQIVEELKNKNQVTSIIPTTLENLLNEKNSKHAHNLRNLFIRTIYLEYGVNCYGRVKNTTLLQNLVPEILTKSQSKDFVDIFLMVPNYQAVLTEFIKSSSVNLLQASTSLENRDAFVRNLIIYRHLLDFGGLQEVPAELVQNQKLQIPPEVLDRNHLICPVNHSIQDLDHHFLFLLHSFYMASRKSGILKPFQELIVKSLDESQLYLPTFPDVGRKMREINSAVQDFKTWNTCPNGHLYLVGECGKPFKDGVCPECKTKIGGKSMHEFQEGNKNVGTRDNAMSNSKDLATGYIESAVENEVFERGLDRLSGNVIRCFLHMTLYLKSSNSEMAVRARKNVTTLSAEILAVSEDDAWKFLVHVLVSASNQTLCGSFQSEDAREEWEKGFAATITNARKNLASIMKQYDDSYRQDCRMESNSLSLVLYGDEGAELPIPNNFDEELLPYEIFWMRAPRVSFTAFRAQVYGDEKQFQFLSALFDDTITSNIKHIPELIQLFRDIIYFVSKYETSKTSSLREFLRNLPAELHQKLEGKINVYMHVWNELVRHRMNIYKSISCNFKGVLSLDSPFKFFLPSRHIDHCCVLVTMNFLISSNNNLVERYRGVCEVETT